MSGELEINHVHLFAWKGKFVLEGEMLTVSVCMYLGLFNTSILKIMIATWYLENIVEFLLICKGPGGTWLP